MICTLDSDKFTEHRKVILHTKMIPMLISAMLGILISVITIWDVNTSPRAILYSLLLLILLILIQYYLEISSLKKRFRDFKIELTDNSLIIHDTFEKDEILFENISGIKEKKSNLVIQQKKRPKEIIIHKELSEFTNFKQQLENRINLDFTSTNNNLEKVSKYSGYFLIISFLINSNNYVVTFSGIVILIYQLWILAKMILQERINIPTIYRILFKLPIVVFISIRLFLVIKQLI